VKTEPPAASPANAAAAQARPAPKTPAPDWAQKAAEARPAPADKTVVKNGKPPAKVDDPFGDLDSLETEMARLLGREKPD
jgi:hypothetical protein